MSIHRYLTILIVFILSSTTALKGGDSIYISISEINGAPGDIVCVDITVDSFENMGVFSFGLYFDPSILEVQIPADVSMSCLNDPNGTLGSGDFSYFQSTGQVRCLWLGAGAVEKTIADGCNLFTICFEIIGEIGDCSPIGVNTAYTEFNDFDTNEIIPESVVTEGEICVVSPDLTCVFGRCNPTTGNNDGSFYFTAVGGTGPYMYDMNGSTGTLAEFEEVFFDNQGLGTYPLTITDATGQMCMTNIILFDNGGQPAFSVMLDTVDPTCFDKDNGTVSIANVIGGVEIDIDQMGNRLFKTEWSNGVFNTTEIDDLFAGNYSVTLTDALGCRTTADASIFADTLKVMVEVLSLPTCNGANDGSVKVTAMGGTPGTGGVYEFDIDRIGGDLPDFYREEETANMATFTNMPNGIYEVKVTDDKGCVSDVVIITFDQGPNFDVEISFDVDPCIGGASQVTFTPSIGTGWGSVVTDTVTDVVFPTFSGPGIIGTIDALPPATYCLDLTVNTLGCFLDTCFVIPDNNPLTLSYDSIAPDCMGDTGSITVSADGGTNPYTYAWSIDATGGDMRDMLGGGTYGVTVTDINGCRDSIVVTFIDGDMIPLQASILTAISCSGSDDGSVIASVTGSTDFTFSWSDGMNDLGMGDTKDGLSSGTYYVTATDSQGCMANDSVFLAEPNSNITVDVMQTGPSCANANDGILSPTAMGGSLPYTYVWKDPITDEIIVNGQVFTGVPGDYKLCISDGNGCSTDTLLTMTPPGNAITVSVSSIIGVACFDECTGQAIVEATGGDNPGGSFVYRVNGTIVGNSDMPLPLNDLCPGTNWVIASDASCASDTLFFEVPNQPTVGTDDALNQLTNPICRGESTGSIEVELDGIDISNATLIWVGQGASGPLLENIPAGEYILEIAYGMMCTVRDTFYLTDPEELFVEFDINGSNGVNCNGDESGRIQYNVFGGNPGIYTYQWNPDVSDSNIAENLSAGTYEVTVTDSGGCSKTRMHILESAEPVQADIPRPPSPNCNGEQTVFKIDGASGGVGGYTFSILNGPRIDLDSCINLFAGEYEIKVFDNAGCSFDTTIIISQPEEITVEVGPDQSLNLGQSSTPISVQPISEFPIDSFAWSPLTNLEFQNPEQQIAIATPLETTLYTVTVTDENGCTATDDVLVEVVFRRNVYRPNAFSPNGDEVNDNFQLVTGYGVEEVLYLYVYDRWGNRVYAEENYMPNDISNPGWNGDFNGQPMEPGVYVFVAEVRFDDGKTIKYSGDVTLIR